jgi:hypothetical protein
MVFRAMSAGIREILDRPKRPCIGKISVRDQAHEAYFSAGFGQYSLKAIAGAAARMLGLQAQRVAFWAANLYHQRS